MFSQWKKSIKMSTGTFSNRSCSIIHFSAVSVDPHCAVNTLRGFIRAAGDCVHRGAGGRHARLWALCEIMLPGKRHFLWIIQCEVYTFYSYIYFLLHIYVSTILLLDWVHIHSAGYCQNCFNITRQMHCGLFPWAKSADLETNGKWAERPQKVTKRALHRLPISQCDCPEMSWTKVWPVHKLGWRLRVKQCVTS